MAIPILKIWKNYYSNSDEGLGSSYERIILNLKIISVCRKYKISSLLEAPSFGFTGISGINSVYLAKNGISVDLVDHNKERLEYIDKTWKDLQLKVGVHYSEDYMKLDFTDNSFDLSWNFSALWFTKNLETFLKELTRVTKKVIVLCVPNRAGIGYLSQKYSGKEDLKKYLKEEHIIPKNFIRFMRRLNWKLVENDFIDNPPWPDIGMPKEKFLKNIGLSFLVKEDVPREPLSILDFYKGLKPEFQDEMLKYYWLEKRAPRLLKRFWSHHRYYIFVPEEEVK
ncbi:class I SAM-dependent methyltransferase [Candidatus Cloacimonadota bacterium]